MKLEIENSSVSKLNVDVLVKVFEYLINKESDNNSVMSDFFNATLVCKRWNKIISESARLLDKIVLKLDQSRNKSEVVLEDFNLTRHYRHVIIRDFLHQSKSIVNKVTDVCENYLTTLELDGQVICADTMRRLSICKHLQTVKFFDCLWDIPKTPDVNNESETKMLEFNRLRDLRLKDTSPMRILNFIKCERLDNFEASSMRYENDAEPTKIVNCLINFLNQLDECNNIKVAFRSWNFETQLEPKFRWSKMNLTCVMKDAIENANAVASIEALGKASQVNAVSDITIEDLTDGNERLWEPILNSCNGIETLRLKCISLSRRLTELKSLEEVKTLSVNPSIFSCENFAYFTTKLPNVNRMLLQMPTQFVTVTEMLQPFFDRITDLSFHLNYVSAGVLRKRGDFCDINFANLQTITIEEIYSFREIYPDESFLQFCALNGSLHQINLEVCDIDRLNNPRSSYLLRWFDLFNGTNIKTCKVMIKKFLKKEGSPRYIAFRYLHWRKFGISEEKVFGRLLTGEENSFFI